MWRRRAVNGPPGHSRCIVNYAMCSDIIQVTIQQCALRTVATDTARIPSILEGLPSDLEGHPHWPQESSRKSCSNKHTIHTGGNTIRTGGAAIPTGRASRPGSSHSNTTLICTLTLSLSKFHHGIQFQATPKHFQQKVGWRHSFPGFHRLNTHSFAQDSARKHRCNP